MEESAYFSVGGLFTDLVWCAPLKMGLMHSRAYAACTCRSF